MRCPCSQSAPRTRTPLNVKALRVNNVEIPNSKRVETSLQYIFGIGITSAKAILSATVSDAHACMVPYPVPACAAL
jgi:small subunit ribosomal protein S13